MGATTTSVEQRWSQRRAVSVPVEVCDEGHVITQTTSRDIGLGGVFLSFESNSISNYQDVDLFFNLDSEEGVTRHKLKAKMVRNAEDGAGFMFKDFDTNAFRALQEIMRYSSNIV